MIEDLLFISKNLLDYLKERSDLDEKDREYMLGVIRRTIFILLIELRESTS